MFNCKSNKAATIWQNWLFLSIPRTVSQWQDANIKQLKTSSKVRIMINYMKHSEHNERMWKQTAAMQLLCELLHK